MGTLVFRAWSVWVSIVVQGKACNKHILREIDINIATFAGLLFISFEDYHLSVFLCVIRTRIVLFLEWVS